MENPGSVERFYPQWKQALWPIGKLRAEYADVQIKYGLAPSALWYCRSASHVQSSSLSRMPRLMASWKKHRHQMLPALKVPGKQLRASFSRLHPFNPITHRLLSARTRA
jgi:hypothetical protein